MCEESCDSVTAVQRRRKRYFCRFGERKGRRGSQCDIGILEVRDSLSHASDASDDVAMGDHDTLGDACGAAGVHDDRDVRGL